MADVKLLTSWNTQFYKNITNNGGAMASAIKNKKTHDINIHSQTEKYGRIWGFCTPERLLTLIEKNHGIYEIITNFPYKVYFDIDKQTNGLIPTDYLVSVKNIILELFPNADMGISGSITQTKISYHIILNNYMILNKDQQFVIREIVKYIATTIDASFDWKVYTSNRNMKCINQSKLDGRVQDIIEQSDFKKHLITCHFFDYLSFPTFNQKITEVIHIEKSKQPFNVCSLPKMVLITPKNIDLSNPESILSILPLNKSFDFSYSHLIARFCYHNNITFDTYLSWLKNKYPDLAKTATGQSQWNDLAKYPPVSISKIKAILSYFYPKINKNRAYLDFIDTFKLEFCIPIETITQKCFNYDNKYAIFCTGMGSGKTAQTIQYLESQPQYIWICPNRALASNTHFRLGTASHYLDFSSAQKKQGILSEQNKLIVVLNSLHYITRSFDVVVIDEIETLLDKLLGDFIENKKIIWNNFCSMIRNAKKVILLDAFITTKTLNFIKDLDQSGAVNVFTRIKEPQTRTIMYMDNFNTWLHDIITKLKDGAKLFIFYPFKKFSAEHDSMEGIFNLIEQQTGKHGIFYNADIDDKIKFELKDVNKAWSQPQFILTNNIITCGVNYEHMDFDYKYICIAKFNTPRDIIQISYRARHLTSRIIKICYFGRMEQINTWENDTHILQCPIYTALYNNILIEKKAPIKQSFQYFCKKAHYEPLVDEFTISKLIDDDIEKLLEEHAIQIKYSQIDTITSDKVVQYEKLCIDQKALLHQKAELNKYYYINQFTDDTKEHKFLSSMWHDNCQKFIKQLKYVLTNSDCIFNAIAKFNKLPSLFPTDIKKIKLNDAILNDIFNKFTFKFITKISSVQKILTEIYNIYFCTFIVSIKYNGTHIEYTIDPLFNQYYDFCKENLILDHCSNETFNNMQSVFDGSVEI